MGDDTLTGGEGRYIFFADVFGHDVITDFNEAEDKLEFSGTLSEADLIEGTDADGNRVLKTGDGLNSITFGYRSEVHDSENEINIAISLGKTGPITDLTSEMFKAANLAVDEINAAGLLFESHTLNSYEIDSTTVDTAKLCPNFRTYCRK